MIAFGVQAHSEAGTGQVVADSPQKQPLNIGVHTCEQSSLPLREKTGYFVLFSEAALQPASLLSCSQLVHGSQ